MNPFVLRLELRRSRSVLFWLGLTIVLYAGMMSWFYPRIVDQTETVNEMLKLWPKEMLAAFNIEGNLTDLGNFYNVYVFSLIWPIIAALGAILLPTRTLGADVERGFLDLSLATPVSRARYLTTSIVSHAVGLAVLAFAMIVAVVGAGWIVGVDLDAGRFAIVGVGAFLFACAIAALTTLVASLTLSRGAAAGIVAGLLVVMYLGQTISKLAPELQGLSSLTVFRYFVPPPIIDDGAVPAGDLAVLAGFSLICWAAATWWFSRRNIVA